MFVAVFLMVNSMHGLISHFNVDMRIGWLNYIFVGPELHRYHHSASRDEAKNYGATTAVYDLLFGSFVYRPGLPPDHLGVDGGRQQPEYEDFLRVMKLPFGGRL
ncbi:MAG: sterol desaturase family protein [Burkholderiaceae bacterium]